MPILMAMFFTSVRKIAFTSRTGATAPCREGAIRMFMWTGFISSEIGAESLKMSAFWWQSAWMRTVTVRSSELRKA